MNSGDPGTQRPAFCDTHAHFAGDDVLPLLQRAAQAGVTRIVAVGGSAELNSGAVAAQRAAPQQVLLALGLDRAQAGPGGAPLAAFEAGLAGHDVCALGEIGLDYHHEGPTRLEQLKLFAGMLDMAARRDLPVIIHARQADDDTLASISEAASPRLAAAGRLGVLHCFTGTRAFARRALDAGLFISFSGIVTFGNAAMLREVAAYVPADRLLIETDAPFLTPVPLRGKPNEPAFVTYVAACVARQRNTSVEALSGLIMDNASRLFGNPDRQGAPA